MPTLTTNAEFLRYAEDEYLSEFHLRALAPKPSSRTMRRWASRAIWRLGSIQPVYSAATLASSCMAAATRLQRDE